VRGGAIVDWWETDVSRGYEHSKWFQWAVTRNEINCAMQKCTMLDI